MSTVSLSACHIGSANGQYEPRRENNFTLIIPGMTHVGLTLQTCGAPQLSIQPVEVDHGNQTKKVASAGKVNDIPFSCFDDLDGNTSDELQGWYDQGYNARTAVVGLARDYKRDCTLISAKPNGEIAKKYKLLGAWLSDFAPMGKGFDMSGKTNKVMLDCTLTVDEMIPD